MKTELSHSHKDYFWRFLNLICSYRTHVCTCIYEKKSEKLSHFFLPAINQGSMLSTRKNFGLALFHPKYASYHVLWKQISMAKSYCLQEI